MPTEPYRTIVADPPWPIAWSTPSQRTGGVWGGKLSRPLGRRTLGYDRMSLDDIVALPVGDLAAEDSVLFLWTVEMFLLDGSAAAVATAWGFGSLRTLVWRKRGFGLGTFPRPQHETIVIGRRGKAKFHGPKNIGSVQHWPSLYEKAGRSVARKHSAKPEAFLDMVESVSPGPYLEMFARRNRLGWDTWGNESLEHINLEGTAA